MNNEHHDSGQHTGLIHRTDLIIAIIILAICAWLFYLSGQFENVADLFAQDITPEFFPRLLLWFIIGLTLLLPFEHLFGPQNRRKLDKGRTQAIRPMAYITTGLMVALLIAMPWLGTYLTLIAVCILLPLLWGERRWLVLLPYAILFPSIVMWLFSQVLKVYLAPGIFDLDFR